jgi:ABC-type lipoprotein export system ATPase subunit
VVPKEFKTSKEEDVAIPCDAASRPTVINKDQPIKSLESRSRDEIFEAFNMYIQRYKSQIIGGESCNM